MTGEDRPHDARRRGVPDETPHERDTRRLGELLEETRVAMPGVQVLFAFLLAVPFQSRFTAISTTERTLYVIALGAAAAATAAFIAPSAFHRVRFRRRDKAFLVELGNRMVIAGLALLAIAMSSAVTLVASLLYDGAVPALVGAAAVMTFGVLWFAVGMVRGHAVDDDD